MTRFLLAVLAAAALAGSTGCRESGADHRPPPSTPPAQSADRSGRDAAFESGALGAPAAPAEPAAPTEPVAPAAPPTPAEPAAPVIAVAGERLTVNGTPRFLVFLSYFDGVRRQASGGAGSDLAWLAAHVDGIRVLPNWWASTCPLRAGDDTLIDVDGSIRAEVWTEVEALLNAAAANGLVVDLSFTRETVRAGEGDTARVLSHDAYEGALVRLAGDTRYLKGRFPHVLVDVQNEWTRFATRDQIARLVQRVHEADPSRVLAASVSGDAYVTVGAGIPTMVAAYHDPRGREWFTPAVMRPIVAAVAGLAHQPVYLQEPMPASAVCPGQIVDTDMTHFVAAADAAREAGAAAWTFHTRTAFDLTDESLLEKWRTPARAAERAAVEQLMR